MPGKDGFEIRAKMLIQRRLKRKEEIEQAKLQLDQELKTIEEDLIALDRSLKLHYREDGKKVAKEDLLSPVKLGSITVADAIEAVLKERGGKERTWTISKLLLEKGKLKNPKTADSHVRSIVQRSNRFVFIKGGFAALPRVVPLEKQS